MQTQLTGNRKGWTALAWLALDYALEVNPAISVTSVEIVDADARIFWTEKNVTFYDGRTGDHSGHTDVPLARLVMRPMPCADAA
jgi:hypothetical protein